MAPGAAIDELGLRPEDDEVVTRVFGAGKSHPWSDQLTDEIMDWMDSAALSYLKAKRDSKALDRLTSQFSEFLDRIILERFEGLNFAAREIHENPPYHTADRWPRTELSIIRTVVEWAFGRSL